MTRADSAASRRFSHHYTLVPGAVALLALPWLWMVDHLLHAAILLAQLELCAFMIVSSYARGLRPMRLVFFTFTLSWLGVGPLYQVSHDVLAWNDSGLLHDTDKVTFALGLTLLATSSVAAAMWWAGARQRRVDARPAAGLPGAVPRIVVPRAWAPWGSLLGLLAITPLVVATNGGVGAFFASRQERVGDLSSAGLSVAESGGAAVALALLIPAALAVVTAHLFVHKIRQAHVPGQAWSRTTLLDAVGIAAALGLVVLYANPLSNTRFISIAAFGSVALAVLRPRSPRAGRWVALGLAVATLAVYPLSKLLAPEAEETAADSPLAVFGGQDFDGFQQIINALIYVQDEGYALGHYTLSALFFFVPRALWESKATPAAIDVADNRGYWFTNLSQPVHSEFFLDFGVIGMVAIMLAMGYVWARVDHSWLHAPESLGAWLAPYLAMAQLGMMRGPLGSLAPVWLTVVVLLVAAVRFAPGPEDDEPVHPAPAATASPDRLIA
jgi:hypothetical protein